MSWLASAAKSSASSCGVRAKRAGYAWRSVCAPAWARSQRRWTTALWALPSASGAQRLAIVRSPTPWFALPTGDCTWQSKMAEIARSPRAEPPDPRTDPAAGPRELASDRGVSSCADRTGKAALVRADRTWTHPQVSFWLLVSRMQSRSKLLPIKLITISS